MLLVYGLRNLRQKFQLSAINKDHLFVCFLRFSQEPLKIFKSKKHAFRNIPQKFQRSAMIKKYRNGQAGNLCV